jgi:hypothetical protein
MSDAEPKPPYPMMPPPAPSSSPPQRAPVDVNYYHSLLRDPREPPVYMEIAAAGTGRNWVRTLAFFGLMASVAALFVLGFYYFTNSVRVAMVIVIGMLGYMVFMGKMAEGRFDRRL